MRAGWSRFLRSAGAIALLLLGCRAPSVADLQSAEGRVAVADHLARVLEAQEHYFRNEQQFFEFRRRVEGVALRETTPVRFYRGLELLLAQLREGHTGLSPSLKVPFSETVPPVGLLEIGKEIVVAGAAPGVEGGGLRPGDVVLAVDGVPAGEALRRQAKRTAGSTRHGRRARAVANLLSGPVDRPARVRVRGKDGRVRECFPLRFLLDDSIDRFPIGFRQRDVKAVPLGLEAGYVSLPDFRPGRTAEVSAALLSLRGVSILVLDLRGNPGGRIETLQRIAGLFLDEPKILLRLFEGGRSEPVRARPSTHSYGGTLEILIDGRTGSAAELFAAALQDVGRARLVGERTAGSARSRLSLTLPGGVVLHYSSPAEFRRRDGRPVEGVGVAPDIACTPRYEDIAAGHFGDPVSDPVVMTALSDATGLAELTLPIARHRLERHLPPARESESQEAR